MFENTAQVVNQRLKYCDELMQMHTRKERNGAVLSMYKNREKFNKKMNLLRSLITGKPVSKSDAIMVSQSAATTHIHGILDQYNLSNDVVEKTKIAYDLANIVSALKFKEIDSESRGKGAYSYTQMDATLLQILDDESKKSNEVISAIVSNSKINGLFNQEHAKNLQSQLSEVVREHNAEVSRLRVEVIIPRNTVKEENINRLYDEFLEKSNLITDDLELLELNVQYQALYEDERDKFKAFMAETLAEGERHFLEIQQQLQSSKIKMAEDIKNAVLAQSSVTDEDAQKWLDKNVTITNEIRKKCKKNNISVEKFNQTIKDFYIISNGRLGNIKIDTQNLKRAYASRILDQNIEGFVMLDNDFSLRVLWHELAHHLEVDAGIRMLNGAYIKSRSLDGGKLHTLRSLTGNNAFDYSEMAYKTTMFNHYAAKIYKDGCTELSSMGLDSFYDPNMLFEILQNDPESLAFITGLVMMPKSETDDLTKDMRDTLVDNNAEVENNELQMMTQKLADLSGIPQFSKGGFSMSDLPKEDAENFLDQLGAVVFGTVVIPDKGKYYLLSSSKVRVGYRGRAMKGVIAISAEVAERGKDDTYPVFITGSGALRPESMPIQTQDIEKIKAMLLISLTVGHIYGIKDTKGEMNEGYFAYPHISRTHRQYIGDKQ